MGGREPSRRPNPRRRQQHQRRHPRRPPPLSRQSRPRRMPPKIAQDGDEPIGNVATLTGTATVTRNNVPTPLKPKDDIYLNDTLQTHQRIPARRHLQ